MEILEALPYVIYMLLIVLLIVLIVLSFKLLYTVDKTNAILDDIERKAKTFNGLFGVIDGVTDALSIFSDTIVAGITSTVAKVFAKRKKRKKERESEDDE